MNGLFSKKMTANEVNAFIEKYGNSLVAYELEVYEKACQIAKMVKKGEIQLVTHIDEKGVGDYRAYSLPLNESEFDPKFGTYSVHRGRIAKVVKTKVPQEVEE